MFQTADDRAFFYIDGGAIPFDAPCYVERAADRQLRELLARGEWAYVLTASQMGKTSLIFRAQAELRLFSSFTARRGKWERLFLF